jgi:hypothetical protein
MGYAARASKLRLVDKRSKMREIDLTPYDVTIQRKSETGEIVPAIAPYDIKTSISGILFLPDLKISGREAVKRDKLCEKIEAAENSILLEEADWKKIVDAIEALPGVGRNDVKFIQRVLEAPEIDITKKIE